MGKARIIMAIGAGLIVQTAAVVHAAKPLQARLASHYTKLSQCRDLGRNGLPVENEMPDYNLLRCKGPPGYSFDVEHADSRDYLVIRTPSGQTYREGFAGDLNDLGDTVEWRVSQSRQVLPHAVIARFFLDSVDGQSGRSRRVVFLSVIKLTAREVCRVALVPGSATDNVKARAIADASAERPCMTKYLP